MNRESRNARGSPQRGSTTRLADTADAIRASDGAMRGPAGSHRIRQQQKDVSMRDEAELRRLESGAASKKVFGGQSCC